MKPAILFYVQHLLGIGHQMRASQLARAMDNIGLDVHYVSGGFADIALDLGGATFHQLSPIKSGDAGFSNLVGENSCNVDDAYWQKRQDHLQKIITDIRPAAYLIEGFPFARRKFSKEIIPLLEDAKTQNKPVFGSIRDILVPPSSEKKSNLALQQVKEYFTKILVHGDENFIPLSISLPESTEIAEKLYYTGYVAPSHAKCTRPENDEIIVSAGGGAVGAALLLTCLKVAQQKKNADQVWRFLVGPNLPKTCLAELTKHQNNKIIIESARPDFRELLAKSKLSISQAGYNTIMDLMVTKTPCVLIPFGAGHESEQPLRAQLLEKHNLAINLSETDLSPQSLATAIEAALLLPAISHIPFKMDGANITAKFIKTCLEKGEF